MKPARRRKLIPATIAIHIHIHHNELDATTSPSPASGAGNVAGTSVSVSSKLNEKLRECHFAIPEMSAIITEFVIDRKLKSIATDGSNGEN
jgi:hypothetical protein